MDDTTHNIAKLLSDATSAINSIISRSKKNFGQELSEWSPDISKDKNSKKKKLKQS